MVFRLITILVGILKLRTLNGIKPDKPVTVFFVLFSLKSKTSRALLSKVKVSRSKLQPINLHVMFLKCPLLIALKVCKQYKIIQEFDGFNSYCSTGIKYIFNKTGRIQN